MSKSILNIPANYHFFNSLFCFIDSQDEILEDFIIFLPNRRSCRELTEIIAYNKPNIFLPKIKAISDITYEDFFEIFNCNNYHNQEELKDELKAIIDQLKDLKSNDSLSQILLIADEIRKINHFGHNIKLLDSLKIATDLGNFFDEVEKGQIDSKKVLEIDDFDLSLHRQINLDFLQKFYSKIQNNFIKNKIHSRISFDNLIIEEYIGFLRKCQPSRPILIAGSTGSISYGRNLIKAIYDLEKGYVVTHGLKKIGGDVEEKHPQFYLQQLLNYLNCQEILDIKYDHLKLSEDSRVDFISNMLDFNFDNHVNSKEIEDNFCIIEAKNDYQEARIISRIINQKIKLGKSVAVISSDNDLLNLINFELQATGIDFNDSRDIGILDNALVKFFIDLLDLIDSDFNSHTLLAIIKNPICRHSKDHETIYKFELNILRKARAESGLSGIIAKLEEYNDSKLKSYFSSFLDDIENLGKVGKNRNLGNQLTYIIKIIDNLSQDGWENLLSSQECYDELNDFFNKIISSNLTEGFNDNLANSFKYLFAQIGYFRKSSSKHRVQILSHVESRSMNFDCIILPSLNQDSFPEKYEYKWLGKKIKQQLDIDDKLKKIGQNSYSFSNYLGNREIYLSRHSSRDGKITLESIFLIKFKIICQKKKIKINYGEEYFKDINDEKNIAAIKVLSNPKPPLDQRFKEISVTDIGKLIQNPYRIYIKKILKLREIDKIDYTPQNREFGIFIHEILEELVQNKEYNSKPDLFTEKALTIFLQYFKSEEDKIIWWPRITNIINNFYQDNQELKDLKNYTEVLAEMTIADYKINCRIDRVVVNKEGKVKIIDYKTGQPPQSMKVVLGIEPQMTLSALSLIEGSVNGNHELKHKLTDIESLIYWKISSFKTNSINSVIKNKEDLQLAIIDAKSGLTKLLEYFSDQDNGFIAKESDYFDQYWHLSRSN